MVRWEKIRRLMRRRSFLGMLPGALAAAAAQAPEPGREAAAPNRPRVPGTLSLRTRRRGDQPPGSDKVGVSEQVLRWEVAQTAIIICDMWDTHTCNLSAQRVAVMAPRMNQVVSAARSLGDDHSRSQRHDEILRGNTRATADAASAHGSV